MKLIIDIPEEAYECVKITSSLGWLSSFEYADVIKSGVPLDNVIAKLEEHKYSREYCIEHGIDWAIDMGIVRIILNNIGKESEGNR